MPTSVRPSAFSPRDRIRHPQPRPSPRELLASVLRGLPPRAAASLLLLLPARRLCSAPVHARPPGSCVPAADRLCAPPTVFRANSCEPALSDVCVYRPDLLPLVLQASAWISATPFAVRWSTRPAPAAVCALPPSRHVHSDRLTTPSLSGCPHPSPAAASRPPTALGARRAPRARCTPCLRAREQRAVAGGWEGEEEYRASET